MMIRMKKCRNQIILSTENIRSMLSWSLHSAGSLTTEVIPTHQWRRTPAPQWWTYHRRSPPLKTPLVHLFMSDISGRPVPVSDISWYRCLSYICVHQILVDVQCLCLISLDIGVFRIYLCTDIVGCPVPESDIFGYHCFPDATERPGTRSFCFGNFSRF